jgi:chemotaxis protein methyltransferase CheR
VAGGPEGTVAAVSAVVGGPQVDRFRAVVAGRLGLALEGFAPSALAELLRRRVAGHGGSCEDYLARLASDRSWGEVSALARELTVNETYFLRNREQFLALAEVVLPTRLRARAAERRLSLLSVGCASGEEAYTLAMVIRDVVSEPGWQVSIVGVDVSDVMLRKAERGRYSPWALRALPDRLRRRWFHAEGQSMVLDEEIRRSVRFVERNLMDDDAELWRPGDHDAIFCRNVIMYFTRDSGAALVDRLVRGLAPGGYLFLGHAENLRDYRGDLQVRHTHETFYYQRGSAGVEPSRPVTMTPTVPVARDLAGSQDWMGAIDAATGRIRELAAHRPRAARSSTPTLVAPVSAELEHALHLLRREQFAAALAVVESLPDDPRSDPETLLLYAVLLIQCGRTDRAEQTCGRLLDRDGINAGAHYLLGLCRESVGDATGAARHNHAAAHLDPTFALPRLRLGILARRRGEVEAARRELGRALVLLSREDAHRLLLFAGGFTRRALTELCRSELAACGARP